MRSGEDSDLYRKRIDKRLQQLRGASPSAQFSIAASAESNGLTRARVQPGDEVALLTSETEDGRICAERLARMLEDLFSCAARVHEIKGLQVRDGKQFRQVGVDSLFTVLDRLIENRAPTEVQLHATGGFKGVVPYLVIYGMFRSLSVSYVYEFSDSLISLPPLPVEFDWTRLGLMQRTIAEIARAGSIPEAQWKASLPPEYWVNADRFDLLFEFEDGEVTLSAIGRMMKSRLESVEQTAEVLLSPQASEALSKAGHQLRLRLHSMLSRVRNPLQRAISKHAETVVKSDLKVWKVYGSSGPRMMYWLAGGRVLVGELFSQHDAYENYIDGDPRDRADYDVDKFVRLTDLVAPDPEMIVDDIRAMDDEPAQLVRALEDEKDSLKLELEQMHMQLTKLQREAQREDGSADQARLEQKLRSQIGQQYGAKLADKKKEIQQLNGLINELYGDISVLGALVRG